MYQDEVVLVDSGNHAIGTMEKLEAHVRGCLHRAFSVFVFNEHHELLLQRRALCKYHSGGLWSNTCCSHPLPYEPTPVAAQRRLYQEMGLYVEVMHIFDVTYRARVENGLIEHEYDQIFIGYSNLTPKPNQHEVDAWRYATRSQIATEISLQAVDYTPWFKLILPGMLAHLEKLTPPLSEYARP
ncbi:isopentenyl-diphosphate Delta-isomerase [Candidatus Neomarinimicrobiota bacterium]